MNLNGVFYFLERQIDDPVGRPAVGVEEKPVGVYHGRPLGLRRVTLQLVSDAVVAAEVPLARESVQLLCPTHRFADAINESALSLTPERSSGNFFSFVRFQWLN